MSFLKREFTLGPTEHRRFVPLSPYHVLVCPLIVHHGERSFRRYRVKNMLLMTYQDRCLVDLCFFLVPIPKRRYSACFTRIRISTNTKPIGRMLTGCALVCGARVRYFWVDRVPWAVFFFSCRRFMLSSYRIVFSPPCITSHSLFPPSSHPPSSSSM